MSRLDGKIAIVTGSASGIGRQIALRFAREGARVAVADLNLGAAQEVASEIARGGSPAIAVGMNVADEAQVEAGVAEVATRLGGVDILVSNAGIQHIAPLVDLTLADGSVRFIKAQCPLPLFQALATRVGGEILSPDQF